jgi:hypothetical protein
MANENKGTGTTTPTKKVSLMEKIKGLLNLKLVFTGITTSKDSDGNVIAVLQLAKPIPYVRGSQEVEYAGKRQALQVSDVKEVKVHQKNFENNPDFAWDEETNTGTFEGSSLSLDVAKSSFQVWMVDVPFATAGNAFRNTARQERLGKFLGLDKTGNPTPKDELKPTP